MPIAPADMSSSSFTAADVMDHAAVLLNDPAKTDYTYIVLAPFLRLAYHELVDSQKDSQGPPLPETTFGIILPVGSSQLYASHEAGLPHFPNDLTEIQEVAERQAGTDGPFIPMKRVEFLSPFPAMDKLVYWAWAGESIRFNQNGATTPRELQLKYIRGLKSSFTTDPDIVIGGHNSFSYLIFKTAAFAAMFIGENPERASVLDDQAVKALERHESISNKGRQQIMTRHRPFRAAWKARGGF